MRRNEGILHLTGLLSVLAVASLSCGVSSLAGLFATATPTATQTFTPTLTSASSPTLTAAPTFAPTSTPLPAGTDTQTLSEGAMLFIDYDKKYQIQPPHSTSGRSSR